MGAAGDYHRVSESERDGWTPWDVTHTWNPKRGRNEPNCETERLADREQTHGCEGGGAGSGLDGELGAEDANCGIQNG